MKQTHYKNWTLIQWDGNPSLNFQCWRKSFGKGHVSVGVGDFTTVVYSYGPDSDDSYSSTRERVGSTTIPDTQAMRLIDANKGKSGV